MAQATIDLLNRGTEANRADRFRRGNVICLPAEGGLIITGDIHGHRHNFERMVAYADLGRNPERHIVLQEVIHGGPENSGGGCLSYQLLFDVVRYKVSYPDRVHIVMGNHDLSFISDSEVLKDGKEMNRSIRSALDDEFQGHSEDVKLAIKCFLFSQPLAVRCANRVWLSHSLPSDQLFEEFDRGIFDRELEQSDLIKPGSAYILIWGRKHSQALLDRMAELLDVDIFIIGHQPQPQGWCQGGRNLLIIASDHNHGCLLPIDLAESYTIEQLQELVVPLASIGVGG
ncbi:MAG TPA: metallophosphoesterase [Sedimentisphaerales bacterium]|nr:metallophosphoesterase [Sedimentisphaerales bacterium]